MAEEKIRQLLEELSFPILYETGGGNEYISPNIYTYTGIFVEEFSANRNLFPGKINPEDYVEANHKIREWHKHNEPGVLLTEFRFKTAFGESIWMEDHILSVKKNGKGKFMTGIMMDITHEKTDLLTLLQKIYAEKEESGKELQKKKLKQLEETREERKKQAEKLLSEMVSSGKSMEKIFTSFYPSVS
ncbi:MAG: PAS domain-containing protein [Bacteroidota bacterium]